MAAKPFSDAGKTCFRNICSRGVDSTYQFFARNKESRRAANEQDKWLKKDQLALFEVLKERDDKKKEADKITKSNQPKRPKEIYTNDAILDNILLSPTAEYITYRSTKGVVAPNQPLCRVM